MSYALNMGEKELEMRNIKKRKRKSILRSARYDNFPILGIWIPGLSPE